MADAGCDSCDDGGAGHSLRLFSPFVLSGAGRLESSGLAALVPQRPGRGAGTSSMRKLMTFLQKLRSEDPSLRPPDLVGRIRERFGRSVHVRSVERALARQKKNGGDNPRSAGRRCGGGLRGAAQPHAGGFAERSTFRHDRAFARRGCRWIERRAACRGVAVQTATRRRQGRCCVTDFTARSSMSLPTSP